MTRAPLTLGTAGHIDHGKTALVLALTGVDTDRLAQERARGISIELGFAPLVLPGGRRLSVVDVPGHERFVRTMIAGASGIDLALLAVACDDGVMPQTREHLAICELMGVAALVVALTKRDAVDEASAQLAALEVSELVEPTPYFNAALIETSVRTGLGLDALRAAIEQAAAGLCAGADAGPPRLWVDRSFTLRGIGTVVTGTLRAGQLRAGDRLAVLPRGNEVRVRSLEVHDVAVEQAVAGQRVAVALAGSARADAPRGSLLTAPGGAMRASYRLDVRLQALPAGPGLAHGRHMRVLLGTAEVDARVVLLDGGELAPGASGLAQLRLATPLAAVAGERFVLRPTSPPATVAGGVVIDPAPQRHAAAGAARARLERIEAGEAADPPARAARPDPPPRPTPPPPDDSGDVRLPGGIVAPRAELERARAAVLELGAGGATFTLAQVRDALGSSRRVVQALLEHLDGEAVTRRVGDARVLRTRGRGVDS